MKKLIVYLLAALVLLSAGCIEPAYHLERYSTTLIPTSGNIQIENGIRELHGEVGFSIAGSFKKDSAEFSEGSYYDTKSRRTDNTVNNTVLNVPTYFVDVYGAILGKRLVSGYLELQTGKSNNKMYYSFGIGPGIRLFKDHSAGRFFLIAGVSNAFADVNVLKMAAFEDYDLIDSYRTNRKFIGMSFSINSTYDGYINPYFNIKALYHLLFSYEEVSVYITTVSAGAGCYRQFGPVTLSTGMQLNTIYMQKLELLGLQYIMQFTYNISLHKTE